MSSRFFITGTDTGVGKTYLMQSMIQRALKTDVRVAALKPVATGVTSTYHEETTAYQAAGLLPAHCYTQWAFEPAIAPHLAAKLAGVSLSVETIVTWCQAIFQKDYEQVLIEGAGGLMVPLNATETWLDLLTALNIPVILVVGIRLGCINHALLTANTLLQAGVALHGWVANHLDPACKRQDEIVQTLCDRIHAPCLDRMTYQPI